MATALTALTALTASTAVSTDVTSSSVHSIRRKYPDRIPIFVSKDPHSNVPMISKTKFLTPYDITVGQFIYIIRKWIKLRPEESLFIFINNSMPTTSLHMKEVYDAHKSVDEVLRIVYSTENTFGGGRLASPLPPV